MRNATLYPVEPSNPSIAQFPCIDSPRPRPLPRRRAAAARPEILPRAGRDLIIAGLMGALVVGKDMLALVAGAAFIVALGTAGLVVGDRAGAVVEQPRLVSEVQP